MSSIPLVCPLFSRPDTTSPWQRVGTAFRIAPNHLLTARHCLDAKYAQKVGDYWEFLSFSERAEFAVSWPVSGLKNGDNMAREARVVEILRPENPTLDAAVLRIEEGGNGDVPASVVWLDGLDASHLERTGLTKTRVTAHGYPAADPHPRVVTHWSRAKERSWAQLAMFEVSTEDGISMFRLPGGGVAEGMSGGPVMVHSHHGTFCIGLARLGGERAPTATVLGAGAILGWLKGQPGIRSQMPSMDARDLPPECVAEHLGNIRNQVHQLLVPLLDSARENASHVEGSSPIASDDEATFIRVFVSLHARAGAAMDGDAGLPGPGGLRPEVERDLYEGYRGGFQLSGHQLPDYKTLKLGEKTDAVGSRLLECVRAAVTHCAGPQRHTEPAPGTLNDGQLALCKDMCRSLNDLLDSGAIRLVERPMVWDALQSGHGVVLAGGAGSGKSTVAQFVALALAAPGHRAGEGKLKALFERAELMRGRVPVFLRLRDVRGRWEGQVSRNDPRILSNLIEACVTAALGSVAGQVQRQDLVVIWDGMDELGEDSRPAFAKGLAGWMKEAGKGAFSLVTTRPTAYPPADPEGASRLSADWCIDGFGLWHLEPLDPMQQRELLLGFLQAFGVTDAETRAGEVFHAIRGGQLEDMAKDPLLLAALVRLARDRWKGPKQEPLPKLRVQVLSETVDLMLYRWEANRAGRNSGPLADALRAAGKQNSWLRDILGELALQSLGRKGLGDFGRDELQAKLQGVSSDAKKSLIEALDDHAGLVRPVEVRVRGLAVRCFEFPVRSYRNFLAAEFLAKKRPVPRDVNEQLRVASQTGPALFLAELVHQGLHEVLEEAETDSLEPEHVRQTMSFAAACAVGENPVGGFQDVWVTVARRRLQEGQSAMPLLRSAVELAMDAGQWTCPADRVPARWDRLHGEDVSRLVDLAKRVRDSKGETRWNRAAAASLVGILDPTTSHGLVGMPARERPTPPGDRSTWCKVGENGRLRFRMGDDKTGGGGGSRSCDLVRAPFYMSRLPVSVEGFHRVGRAAGLNASSYETAHGAWRLPVFQLPTHPVVGVDWATATRWCEEATRLIREGVWEGDLPAEVRSDPFSWILRLPTEAEWEFAARGPEEHEPPCPGPGRMRVPWGWATEEEIRERVNCGWQFLSTTPVEWDGTGTASWCGVEEMSGLVWEWCQTAWVEHGGRDYPEDYERQAARLAGDTGVLRVLRGGSWFNLPRDCRCAHRRAFPPGDRHDNVGFRPVLAPVPEAGRGG